MQARGATVDRKQICRKANAVGWAGEWNSRVPLKSDDTAWQTCSQVKKLKDLRIGSDLLPVLPEPPERYPTLFLRASSLVCTLTYETGSSS